MSLNDFSRNVKTFAPVLGLILVIIVLGIYIFGTNRSSGYSWKGVTPGETTIEKVKDKLGSPAAEGDISETIQILKYNFEGESAKIYVKEGKVNLIKLSGTEINQNENIGGNLSVFYSVNYKDLVIGLYLEEGRGRVANERTGKVVEDWYFAPSDKVDIKVTLEGIEKLQEERPTIF